MLNRNYVIRRKLVYKFGSSDFVTKDSKVRGKKGALKTRAKIWGIFPKRFVSIIFTFIVT